MQFAKVAASGFECETEIVVARALTSVATVADLLRIGNLLSLSLLKSLVLQVIQRLLQHVHKVSKMFCFDYAENL